MASPDFEAAYRAAKKLISALDAEDAGAARAACNKILAALGDEADNAPADKADDAPKKKRDKDYPPFLDTSKARASQRARMGLPVGSPKQAIRVEGNAFVLDAHALAQSKNGRVRA